MQAFSEIPWNQPSGSVAYILRVCPFTDSCVDFWLFSQPSFGYQRRAPGLLRESLFCVVFLFFFKDISGWKICLFSITVSLPDGLPLCAGGLAATSHCKLITFVCYWCVHFFIREHKPLAAFPWPEKHLKVIFFPLAFFFLPLSKIETWIFPGLSQRDPRLYMVFFHVVRPHSQLVQQLNAISYLEEHASSRPDDW